MDVGSIGNAIRKADKEQSMRTFFTAPMLSSSYDKSNGLLSTHMLKEEQKLGKKLIQEIPENHTDLSLIIRKRLEAIDVETKDYLSLLKEFGIQADSELENFINSMAILHQNLKKVAVVNDDDKEEE